MRFECASDSHLKGFVFNIVGNSAKDSEQSSLSAENGKLREALRRLHSQSTSDKSILDALNEKQASDEIELISLRKYQALAKDEITELKELVDSASSYESMIESLTTKNIEYSQAVAQLESTVRSVKMRYISFANYAVFEL